MASGVSRNPAVNRTCAKSRAGRLLLRWTTAYPFDGRPLLAEFCLV